MLTVYSTSERLPFLAGSKRNSAALKIKVGLKPICLCLNRREEDMVISGATQSDYIHTVVHKHGTQ